MARNRILDEQLFTCSASALAVVRACLWCKHVEVRRLGMRGVGRGAGFREGNKARGRMIQHVKAEHPQEYAAAKEAAKHE